MVRSIDICTVEPGSCSSLYYCNRTSSNLPSCLIVRICNQYNATCNMGSNPSWHTLRPGRWIPTSMERMPVAAAGWDSPPPSAHSFPSRMPVYVTDNDRLSQCFDYPQSNAYRYWTLGLRCCHHRMAFQLLLKHRWSSSVITLKVMVTTPT